MMLNLRRTGLIFSLKIIYFCFIFQIWYSIHFPNNGLVGLPVVSFIRKIGSTFQFFTCVKLSTHVQRKVRLGVKLSHQRNMRQVIPRQPPHPHFIQNYFFLVLTFTFSLNVIIWPFIFGNSPGADYVDQKVWRKRLKPDVMDSLSNTKRYTSFINLKMKTTMMMNYHDNILSEDDDDTSPAQYDGKAFKN